jgi:hypothetical protein
MAQVDYDKKKFVCDGYGRLYPKKTVGFKRSKLMFITTHKVTK